MKNPRILLLQVLLLITFSALRANSSINPKYFIDTELEDRQTLISSVEALNYENTFHLFSHGRPGELLIEAKWMNAEQIAAFLNQAINHQPTTINHINIYGCEFARGEKGSQAVRYLEQYLEMKISASDDVTGKDGDWELEIGSANNNISVLNYEGNLQLNCSPNYGIIPGPTNQYATTAFGGYSTGNYGATANSAGVGAPEGTGISVYSNTPVNTNGTQYQARFAYTNVFSGGSTVVITARYIDSRNDGITLEFSTDNSTWVGLSPVINGFTSSYTDVSYTLPSTLMGQYKYIRVQGVSDNTYLSVDAIRTNVGICNTCPARLDAPALSTNAVTIACPSQTYNLNTITASNMPANTELTWHTGTPATDANRVANAAMANGEVFYAAFHSVANSCYSGINGSATTQVKIDRDLDCDGISNSSDIDDDNDGIADAVESPGCFYTETEAKNIISVTSELTQYSTYVLTNSYDHNTATQSAFNTGQNWINKSVFEIIPTIPLAISAINIDLGSWYLSATNTSTFKLQGWTGTAWVDLSAAMSNYNSTVDFGITNSLHPNTVYAKFRIIGVAGTCYYSGVNEITLTSTSYVASAHAKASCTLDTDGDGLFNHQDLDSDGDGCSDVVEGDGDFSGGQSIQTVNPTYTGGNSGTGYTGTSGDPIFNYLGNTSNSQGSPIVSGAAVKQGIGSSQSKNINPCSDIDGDGTLDMNDIDDDNDGIVDAVESPDCFYTETEAKNIISVTSELTQYSTYVITNSYDHNIATQSAFNTGQNWVNKSVFEIIPAIPLAISAVNIDLGSWYLSAGSTASTFKLQGWTGTTWVDLSAAMSNYNSTVDFSINNTIHPNTIYSKFRIAGVAGTCYYSGVNEITLTPNSYVASAHPKAECASDEDDDNIYNHQDLDSDGDGCPDLFEASVTPSTDVITPSVTNNEGDSYGIDDAAGAQLNPVNPVLDTNNDGLNDSVDPDKNGITNYTSTYGKYAIYNDLNYCIDTDGDEVSDVLDIDDDNDGIPDIAEQEELPCTTTNCTSWVAPPTTAGTTAPATIIVDGEEISYTITANTSSTSQSFNGYNIQCSSETVTGLPGAQRVDGLQTVTFNFSKPVTNFQLIVAAVQNSPGFLDESFQVTTNNTQGQQTICKSCNRSGVAVIDSQNLKVFGMGTDGEAEIFSVNGPAFTTITIKVTSVGGAYLMAYGLCGLNTNPDPTYADQDTDGDGIPNRLDLDSDGDGCPDLKEAGVSPATDVITPSVTNNSGTSYGIEDPSNSQLNPNATDANNDGLNDSVDPDVNGSPNYSTSYNPIALSAVLNLCNDSDGDEVGDITDIDDDNDGVLDTVESPTCFYTFSELNNEAYVTSELSYYDAGQPFSLAIDGNTSTYANIQSGLVTNRNLVEFDFPLANPLPISTVTVQIGINNAFPNSSFQLQGWTGNSWEAMSATQAMNTSSTTYTFTNTLHPAKKYNKFRIRGLSGGITNGTRLHEISLTFTQPFVSAQQPKGDCTTDFDGDMILNHLDLDSDGDGCSDLIEAGVSPATDVITPSTTNNEGESYGIDDPAGAQLNPTNPALDTNNDGLNDSVDKDVSNVLDGKTNYASSYDPFALSNNWSLCADTDHDSIIDLKDIDDDNDGILDAVESPDCFYTVSEVREIIMKVTSKFASSTTDSFDLLHNGIVEGNTATGFNFTTAVTTTTNNAGSNIFTLEYFNPIELSSVNVSHRISDTGTATAHLWGSVDGTTWTQLTTTAVNINTNSERVFPVQQNAGKYKYYQIRTLVAGNIPNTYFIGEITGVPVEASFVPSSYPKPDCSNDTDNDEVMNHQDLDSDGDKCPDAVETETSDHAGVTSPGNLVNSPADGGNQTNVPNAIVGTGAPADYGNNGFYNAIEDPAESGHYTGLYILYYYSLDQTINACKDSDGDGDPDYVDLDDDNDGVLNHIESPQCFFQDWEVVDIENITSQLTIENATRPFTNAIDGANTTTSYTGIATGQNSEGKAVYTITLATYTAVSSIQFSMHDSPFGNANVTFMLQGSNGLGWVNLQSAAQTRTVINGMETFAVAPAHLGEKYKRYRVVGVNDAAVSNNSTAYARVKEIYLNLYSFNPSDYPKPGPCTDFYDDGDSVPPYLDLDSDGDKCSDAFEAGATTITTPDYQFPNVDSNSDGLVDVVDDGSNGEVALDGYPDYMSTYVSYAIKSWVNACTDSDDDGVKDVDDIDDDNDGITDIVERNCSEAQTIFDFNSNKQNWMENQGAVTGDLHHSSETIISGCASIPPSPTGTDFIASFDNIVGYANFNSGSTNLNMNLSYALNRTLSFQWINEIIQSNGIQILKALRVELTGGGKTVSTYFNVAGINDDGWHLIEIPLTVEEFGSADLIDILADLDKITIEVESMRDGNGAGCSAGVEFFALDDITIGCEVAEDFDNDGVINRLDLDSDGDGCPDMREAGVYNYAINNDVEPAPEDGEVTNGNGVDDSENETTPVANSQFHFLSPENDVNGNGFVDGLETDMEGQYNDAYNLVLYMDPLQGNCVCYKVPSSGTPLPSIDGITTLSRHNKETGEWENMPDNAFLVLESKEKGFVITRMPDPETTITGEDAVKGMLVYDTDDNCLKMYDGVSWFCLQQGCPE